MTLKSNARLAGFTFLFYIAAGIATMVLSAGANSPEAIAQHASSERITILFVLLTTMSAFLLAVTLYSITRVQDPDIAMLGLICRVTEGMIGAISIQKSVGLLWLGLSAGTTVPDAGMAHALGMFLLKGDGGNTLLGATFFAVGSTLFSYLFLRGRMIPVPLAWLGVVASVLLVICLPLQLAGFLSGPFTQFMWLPMAAFEIPLALWLIIKGVAMPRGS